MSRARSDRSTSGLTDLAVRLGGGLVSLLGLTLFVQTVLETPSLSAALFSDPWRAAVLTRFGGRLTGADRQGAVPFIGLLGVIAGFAALLVVIQLVLRRDRATAVSRRAVDAFGRLGVAWSPAAVWWLAWIVALLADGNRVAVFLSETVDLTAATCLALTLFVVWPQKPGFSEEAGLLDANIPPRRGARLTLIAAGVLYVVVFTAMNWGLYFNLRLPHGDSAMYEEHLWNLEHGKGFRSYLDQGLFLGEHLQVIHLLLIPLHLIYPSQLTLEFAQSVILALGAWPVFRLARRHSGSEWAAALLGMTYLAYFPLQYLDIAIDLKTFRPSALGIPTLLAALDALETRRYRAAAIWLAITLSAQEDFAIPIALIGLWLVLTNRPLRPVDSRGWKQAGWGIGLFVFGVVYLGLALTVIIPWFRGGAPVHTASYFSQFGNTPREIVTTLLTRPLLVLSILVQSKSLLYALRLLLPLAFLPLRSPGRLAVGLPLFLLLCMNDLAMETPAPVHHFHAALVPILFWAAAAGLSTNSTRTVRSVPAVAPAATPVS